MTGNTAGDVLMHPLQVHVVGQLSLEASAIEGQRLRVPQQVWRREVSLVLEQSIVHLPKATLCASGLCRLCRQLRVWMDLGQREVPENEPEAVLESLHQDLDRRIGLSAGRTLEVPVLDNQQRAMSRARDVIEWVERHG